MIKLKTLLLEIVNETDVDKKYPIARNEVDGRIVRKNIDNTSSISSSLTKYKILPGIREVPMSDFFVTGKHYSVDGQRKIDQLASQILNSKEISPLIVVIDKEGPYVLEGATRLDALKTINAKSFPALIVIDLD